MLESENNKIAPKEFFFTNYYNYKIKKVHCATPSSPQTLC